MSNLQCVQVLAGPGAPPHQARVGPRPATAQTADKVLKNINFKYRFFPFQEKKFRVTSSNTRRRSAPSPPGLRPPIVDWFMASLKHTALDTC